MFNEFNLLCFLTLYPLGTSFTLGATSDVVFHFMDLTSRPFTLGIFGNSCSTYGVLSSINLPEGGGGGLYCFSNLNLESAKQGHSLITTRMCGGG